jgi:hypothetical protein
VLPYFIRSEHNQRLVDAYHGYGGPLGVSFRSIRPQSALRSGEPRRNSAFPSMPISVERSKMLSATTSSRPEMPSGLPRRACF